MPSSEDIIIISGYKTKVSYYGIGPLPAWVIGAAPIVAFIVGLLF